MSIEAMKEALDTLEKAYVLQEIDDIIPKDAPIKQTVNRLRQAIEQAEKQEPVADVTENGIYRTLAGINLPIGTKLYTAPQPQREWVGLTEDERDDIWNRYCDEMGEASINDAPDIVQAIEQALKEKNHEKNT
jgi:hypothetical protein